MLSIVRTPLLALLRSMQPLLSVLSHMEPVRSIATTMSTGVDEHGLQAVVCAETSKWSIPKILPNQVFVLAVPFTTMLFGLTAALQLVARLR